MSFNTFSTPVKANIINDGGYITPAYRVLCQNFFETLGGSDGTLVVSGSRIFNSTGGETKVSSAALSVGGVQWPVASTVTEDSMLTSTDGTTLTLIPVEDYKDTYAQPRSTGDRKLTYNPTPDSGWILENDGTIGSASSGATNRANADTEALYTLLWNSVSNTYAPVSSGRGASAAADFAANKTLTLPPALGRALGVAGAGSGLTSRAVGQYLGTENHTLTYLEIPDHGHVFTAGTVVGSSPPQSIAFAAGYPYTNLTGGGGAHNNMQPTTFIHTHLKL